MILTVPAVPVVLVETVRATALNVHLDKTVVCVTPFTRIQFAGILALFVRENVLKIASVFMAVFLDPF